jgi:hypothetical protein
VPFRQDATARDQAASDRMDSTKWLRQEVPERHYINCVGFPTRTVDQHSHLIEVYETFSGAARKLLKGFCGT